MRALTVRQPWADAIAFRAKRVENRTWPAPAKHIGARIMIHAAAAEDRKAILPLGENTARANGQWYPNRLGAVIAVATLTGCHPADWCCAPWGERQGFHWALADVVSLGEPVPVKGALGFWTPPADVFDAVAAQVEVAL